MDARRGTPPAVPAGLPRRPPESLDGALVLRSGDPATVVPAPVAEVQAGSVHVSADAGPYGRSRDVAVERALGDVLLVRTGSPYAVTPGRGHQGRRQPVPGVHAVRPGLACARVAGPGPRPDRVPWLTGVRVGRTAAGQETAARLPAAGEAPALEAWAALPGRAAARTTTRAATCPATDGTSRLSPYLKYGCLHPRTLLADLEPSGARGMRSAGTPTSWPGGTSTPTCCGTGRRPRTGVRRADGRPDLRPRGRRRRAVRRLGRGRTGYPIVDAGMRQLRGEAWVHNRVRMIVASFLVKDLHIDWWRGARHFLEHLVDGDLASNNHGWQWVAGTGTDASPYYRVFNPTRQGQQFDPDGEYVRRWVPELRDVPTGTCTSRGWRPAASPPGIRSRSSSTRTSARSPWPATRRSGPVPEGHTLFRLARELSTLFAGRRCT